MPGRLAAGVIAVVGIGAFALPSGIIAAHFNNVLQGKRGDDSNNLPPRSSLAPPAGNAPRPGENNDIRAAKEE